VTDRHKVGVIGGGQLGRMLALAGIPLGLEFRFLDPAPDAPAGAVGELLVGPYDDPVLLDRLAEATAAVTYEFENVPVEAARRVGAVPGARALEIGQDRLLEKELFRRLGIPTARFGTLADTGLPALVKARRLGYDGKGQRLVRTSEPLGSGELAEELVAFERELSILAVRGRDGDTAFYPLVENVHRDGILRVSRAPAADAPQAEAEAIATRLLDELDYVGVLAVELFEVGEGRLLANELAPRVHNTGHWTIDGAATSQFENHLRAILGLPLGSTKPLAPCAMVNLVGTVPPLERLLALPGARVHLYDKAPRPGRKLGHVTLVGADAGTAAAVERLAGDGVGSGTSRATAAPTKRAPSATPSAP
jgi:5-(carboxyamino)imidazole ribonucleotide synthase